MGKRERRKSDGRGSFARKERQLARGSSELRNEKARAAAFTTFTISRFFPQKPEPILPSFPATGWSIRRSSTSRAAERSAEAARARWPRRTRRPLCRHRFPPPRIVRPRPRPQRDTLSRGSPSTSPRRSTSTRSRLRSATSQKTKMLPKRRPERRRSRSASSRPSGDTYCTPEQKGKRPFVAFFGSCWWLQRSAF